MGPTLKTLDDHGVVDLRRMFCFSSGSCVGPFERLGPWMPKILDPGLDNQGP